VSVVVLERLAEPTGLSKALGLQSRSMEMLANQGILDRFTAGNPAVPFLNFRMFPLDLSKLDFPDPRTVVIPQARVEALLAARAEELGIEIRRATTCWSLRRMRRASSEHPAAPHLFHHWAAGPCTYSIAPARKTS
jgi:2-polyprenyl-6-methoxyphenol hydroxylase-like FAD-dependent oxidoreductase